jgi:NAD(P)-dependent dehydrogenase (short-subunit alcohol dehydrogenase family)
MASGSLAGTWALVTGSTRGLGRTTAEWLASAGASIIVSGREVDAVADSVEAIKAIGTDAIGIAADLSDYSEAHRLAEEAIAAVPSIGILVNNAGMSIRGSFWDVTDEDWDYQVNVNVRSPYVLAQHLAKHMIAKGNGGRIVNVSTIGVHGCHRNAAVYNLAKGAVETMTQNMAFELGPYGVTVNCVAPGNMAIRPGAAEHEDWFETSINTIPVGRLGNADDIANAVRFFCMPETAFTTGQTLLVDGGHNSYLVEALPKPVNDTSDAVDPRSKR